VAVVVIVTVGHATADVALLKVSPSQVGDFSEMAGTVVEE
jgi:hypothetical protein